MLREIAFVAALVAAWPAAQAADAGNGVRIEYRRRPTTGAVHPADIADCERGFGVDFRRGYGSLQPLG
jgi:hypothetical protein